MADPELEEIRKQRLAQLQAEYKNEGGPQQQKAKEDQAYEQEMMKNQILAQILDQAARTRLNTLLLGKPEKGRIVENMLVQMARSGQIRQKIGETQLIEMLENVNKQIPQQSTTVKFDRRRAAFDSDDEDF